MVVLSAVPCNLISLSTLRFYRLIILIPISCTIGFVSNPSKRRQLRCLLVLYCGNNGSKLGGGGQASMHDWTYQDQFYSHSEWKGKVKTRFNKKVVPKKTVFLIIRASHKEPCFERNQEPDKFNDVTVRSDVSWPLCFNYLTVMSFRIAFHISFCKHNCLKPVKWYTQDQRKQYSRL